MFNHSFALKTAQGAFTIGTLATYLPFRVFLVFRGPSFPFLGLQLSVHTPIARL
jgi:hypothetical protein